MPIEKVTHEFTASIRKARMQFLQQVEPLRPELYAFCRSLARNVWDAEDLLQDVLLKSFAKLAEVHWDVENPRAYLFRMAGNLWIDRTRKKREAAMPEEFDPGEETPDLKPEVRDALSELARVLPPMERAAVLLKDVFGFSLNDAANYLETTTGGVKSALHRGRSTLNAVRESQAPPAPPENAATTAMLDEWCSAFNNGELQKLANLMLEDAHGDVIGMVQEYGRDQIRDGSMEHTLNDKVGRPYAERHEYHGEPIIVLWYVVEEDGEDGVEEKKYVRDVLRFTQDRGGLQTLRYYYFCPETLKEVVNDLGLPLKDNGYWYTTM